MTRSNTPQTPKEVPMPVDPKQEPSMPEHPQYTDPDAKPASPEVPEPSDAPENPVDDPFDEGNFPV
jgi:hypothetical protein